VMTVKCHRMRKYIIRLLQWEVGVGDVELGVARQYASFTTDHRFIS